MPPKVAPTKSLVFAFRAAALGNSRSSTPGTGATSPTQLAAVLQLLLTRLPPSQIQVAGARRSSSASSRRLQAERGLDPARECAGAACRFRRRDESNIDRDLFWECGLRYKGRATGPGAQTGRPGNAGRREFAWRRMLTGGLHRSPRQPTVRGRRADDFADRQAPS